MEEWARSGFEEIQHDVNQQQTNNKTRANVRVTQSDSMSEAITVGDFVYLRKLYNANELQLD